MDFTKYAQDAQKSLHALERYIANCGLDHKLGQTPAGGLAARRSRRANPQEPEPGFPGSAGLDEIINGKIEEAHCLGEGTISGAT
jgi:hypothetical protein